tara:strand:- start:1141 stop:2043 length:903 start_codon:yes stop_codon:yes gene_type:complete
MYSKNIGVIGHGFIGQEVVKELLKTKKNKIKILDRNLNIYKLPVSWYRADFRDKKVISEFIKDIDILIHLASSTVPASSTLSAEIDIKENISAMVQILDLAREINPKLYVIFASSSSVYGNQTNLPITELNLPQPISFHGLQKLSIEHFLRIYHQKYNINYATCRISNPYGFGQKNNTVQGLISIIKNGLINNKKIQLFGIKECTRDFIHINDLAKAFVSLCDNDYINCEVNISSGIETRLDNLIEKIEKIYGKNIIADYKELRQVDIKRSVLDNSLIKSLTKWNPLKSLEEGIAEFIKS